MGQSRLGCPGLRERNIIIRCREITTGRETTTAQEITTDHDDTTMGRDEITTSDEITMRDEIQTTATMMIGRGMDVPRGGRFRVETAHPTKARLAEGGILRMVARPVTQYRAASVSRIEGISP